MTDHIPNGSPLSQPRNRQLLIIAGVALLALILALVLWQTTGTRGAKQDLANANEKVVEKQREVDEAKRVLDQRIAELRALRAGADVEATRLGGEVAEDVRGVVDDARLDGDGRAVGRDADLRAGPQEYYVRDRDGRFVRVTTP